MGINIKLTAIKPKMPDYAKLHDAALRKAADRMRKIVEADLAQITSTWATQVKWRVRIGSDKGDAFMEFSTSNKIFIYVDQGTRPHVIRPKKAKALAFLSGYHAKTAPGRLQSTQGGGFGDQVFAMEVNHPGTKPRNYVELLIKRNKRTYGKIVKEELSKVRVR